ncbi:7,8-dihydro-6-hydroxymethylpterin-pyrophosphokinase [Actinobacillus delphinicola]|uniref:2-amino-4-hydroxy-6-hydroxymethyldihydropteridine pyrophosphokinase n=1 Tax=Actinobacillus delphinicola TaxID=51161 RepID=A0A448TVB8_9PAST|nr:2-amino-4-hydroxy-6-hydroxymethyldihydropteridine diphosphokinase [Actinobacillus delphinicola]MDG6898003.1 7,8-dihydro-6-hydroxymethylpterin-pyrophosphokinase [Actinobacillus delphinicola]VEJ09870.1 2-amino-4-hydroxy-6-hydroxymethyldihydropteridinepyrophosphokinase [Actinobacillus delphinicola]
MHQVYIALGSNLQSPVAQLEKALSTLAELPQVTVKKTSPFYQSSPLGPQDQPDFINAVALLETPLSAVELLDILQSIENQQGRIRLRHWGERTLDLDILLFDNDIIKTPRLTVPHYAMCEREFVIIPLFDIAPALVLPTGESVGELRKKFINHTMKAIQ